MRLLLTFVIGAVGGVCAVFTVLGLWAELWSDLLESTRYLIDYGKRLFADAPPEVSEDALARVRRELMEKLEARRRKELNGVMQAFEEIRRRG